MKVAELSFDAGNSSPVFTLGDGHRYWLHRISREGKPEVYSLFSMDGMQPATPYINEGLMDTVLDKRGGSRADPVPEEISDTGFVCPGCGARVTKEGAHFPDPGPAIEPLPVVPAPPAPAPPAPARSRSRFLK
jgi:hypothetical protein